MDDFQIGDYVLCRQESKSGREFFIRGTIMGEDEKWNQLVGNHPNVGLEKKYIILTEDSEEMTIFENKIEIDKQSERDYTLNQIFNNKKRDDNDEYEND